MCYGIVKKSCRVNLKHYILSSGINVRTFMLFLNHIVLCHTYVPLSSGALTQFCARGVCDIQ